MLNSEQLLTIAKRDVKKSQRAYDYNYDRLNCPEDEKENLKNNLEYRKFVLRIIEKYVEVMKRYE